MRLPQHLQPTYATSTLCDRSILESPSPPAFAGDDSFHASSSCFIGRTWPSLAETSVESVIEWSLALTASLQLQHGQRLPSVSRGKAPLGPDEPLAKGPPSVAPVVPASSAEIEGRVPACDALCRAPSRRFTGFDSPLERKRQDPLGSPDRQIRRASLIQSAFHRRRARPPHAFAMQNQTTPAISANRVRSTSTALDHLNPGIRDARRILGRRAASDLTMTRTLLYRPGFWNRAAPGNITR